MKEEKHSLLEILLVIIIGILISYSFYILINYQVERIDSLENNIMKVQEEVVHLKARIQYLENDINNNK
ncbi:MAG TPA: hypothetical protein PKI00_01105 [Candidatus Pacearchaeota archaeon]|nr:hypothetical protein [Candidatus Parcubacteria bacterium]HNP79432.1 hypothetical protein [Candidatus Pacearchaeota archaeon]HOC53591.1 hypothetical protein [Candidatus Pacearchaeota archaeon]HQM24651.1 hypothetical protein [Candidatus Pacearchaeota archaeon]